LNIFSGLTAFLNRSKAAAEREGLYRGGMVEGRELEEEEEGGREAEDSEREAIPLSDAKGERRCSSLERVVTDV